MLIIALNYHKTRIRSIALNALLSQFASILENEAEKKLGVTLDEILEIHRDRYLCRFCDIFEDVRNSSEYSIIGIFLLFT